MDTKRYRLYAKLFSSIAAGKTDVAESTFSELTVSKVKRLLEGPSQPAEQKLSELLGQPVTISQIDCHLTYGRHNEVSVSLVIAEDVEIQFSWTDKTFRVDGNYLATDGDGWNLPVTGGYYEDAGFSKLGAPEITVAFPGEKANRIEAAIKEKLQSNPRILEAFRSILNQYGEDNESFEEYLKERDAANNLNEPDDY